MTNTARHGDISITFTVDGEALTVTDAHQTAGSILQLARLDPALYELAKLRGDGPPFKDMQPVKVSTGDAFVTVRISASVA